MIFFPTGSNIIHDGIESWNVITPAAPSWMILIKKPLVILVAVHSTVWFQCESCLNVESSRSSTWPAAHMPAVFIEPQARHVERCVGSVRLRVHLWLWILHRTKKNYLTYYSYTVYRISNAGSQCLCALLVIGSITAHCGGFGRRGKSRFHGNTWNWT